MENMATIMNIEDYRTAEKDILAHLPSTYSYKKYLLLMEIFVQDCAIDIHQPYFGNVTKQKSKILFRLQKFLTSEQLFKHA